MLDCCENVWKKFMDFDFIDYKIINVWSEERQFFIASYQIRSADFESSRLIKFVLWKVEVFF